MRSGGERGGDNGFDGIAKAIRWSRNQRLEALPITKCAKHFSGQCLVSALGICVEKVKGANLKGDKTHIFPNVGFSTLFNVIRG